jgi:hypothetical protein
MAHSARFAVDIDAAAKALLYADACPMLPADIMRDFYPDMLMALMRDIAERKERGDKRAAQRCAADAAQQPR